MLHLVTVLKDRRYRLINLSEYLRLGNKNLKIPLMLSVSSYFDFVSFVTPLCFSVVYLVVPQKVNFSDLSIKIL